VCRFGGHWVLIVDLGINLGEEGGKSSIGGYRRRFTLEWRICECSSR